MNKKKAFILDCHSELVSESLNHEMLSYADRLATAHYVARARFVKQVQHDKKQAFTLAEVLITLTIIGVIAALTIPNLMQSYKKHQVEVGVKEAYTILANAVQIAETELGTTSEWDYEYRSDLLKTNILPFLKVTKDCTHTDQNFNSDCLCQIKDINGNIAGYMSGKSAVLANGMSIGMRPNHYQQAQIYIDIDGSQKGNCILGKDIFVFTLADKNQYGLKFFPGGTLAGQNYYTKKNLTELLGNDIYGGCSTTGRGSAELQAGALCAAVIAKNGWKIPDDYPIKKF